MSLAVVGACIGRTGTNSLKLALERLGFGPCHHMFEVASNPDQLPYWEALARGESVDWREVFAGYKACVDWPSARFWREIWEVFPDAPVILTLRDPESWFASVQKTILPSMRSQVDMEDGPQRRRSAMAHALIAEQTFAGRMDDFDHATGVYRNYVEDVRRTVPAGRLLEFDVKQGWEPLCAFLGVAVPEEPFPLTNTTEQFRKRRGLD